MADAALAFCVTVYSADKLNIEPLPAPWRIEVICLIIFEHLAKAVPPINIMWVIEICETQFFVLLQELRTVNIATSKFFHGQRLPFKHNAVTLNPSHKACITGVAHLLHITPTMAGGQPAIYGMTFWAAQTRLPRLTEALKPHRQRAKIRQRPALPTQWQIR